MKEIERKFLVKDTSYKKMAVSKSRIVQAYLSTDRHATVRIRVAGNNAWLTIKGCNQGCVRDEWEYPVPVAEALEMCCLARTAPIEKTRWIVPFEGYEWEVDEFDGHLKGLTVAEVEMPDEGCAPPLPDFAGREVTGDARYYNSMLSEARELPPVS